MAEESESFATMPTEQAEPEASQSLCAFNDSSSMFTRCLHYMTLQLMTDCSLLTPLQAWKFKFKIKEKTDQMLSMDILSHLLF